MVDQASGLRRLQKLKEEKQVDGDGTHPAVVAITSGKGGVGKTNIVANLALALIRHQQRVVIMDADYGLANIDVLLALSPRYHLGHVLFGEKTLEEIMVKGPAGMQIIPAGSGFQELTHLSPDMETRLFQGLAGLRNRCDFLLIDTAAGISKNVLRMLLASSQVIVVTQPEPTAIVDAYAVIKVVAFNHPDSDFPVKLLVNNVSGAEEAEAVFGQVRSACVKFLKRDIEMFGYIPWDGLLADCVREQKALMDGHSNSPAGRQFMALGKKLLADWKKNPRKATAIFWTDLFKTQCEIPVEP